MWVVLYARQRRASSAPGGLRLPLALIEHGMSAMPIAPFAFDENPKRIFGHAVFISGELIDDQIHRDLAGPTPLRIVAGITFIG